MAPKKIYYRKKDSYGTKKNLLQKKGQLWHQWATIDLDFQYRGTKFEKTNARLEDIYAPFLNKKEINLLIKLAKVTCKCKELSARILPGNFYSESHLMTKITQCCHDN